MLFEPDVSMEEVCEHFKDSGDHLLPLSVKYRKKRNNNLTGYFKSVTTAVLSATTSVGSVDAPIDSHLFGFIQADKGSIDYGSRCLQSSWMHLEKNHKGSPSSSSK